MRKEVLNQMFIFIIGAFSLVAALAWNSTIESIFKQIFGTPVNLPTPRVCLLANPSADGVGHQKKLTNFN